MAEHRIEVHQPSKIVMNSDYRFEVFSGSEKLGEVRISKGTIDWRPRNARHVMKLTWERFDALMQANVPRRPTRS